MNIKYNIGFFSSKIDKKDSLPACSMYYLSDNVLMDINVTLWNLRSGFMVLDAYNVISFRSALVLSKYNAKTHFTQWKNINAVNFKM